MNLVGFLASQGRRAALTAVLGLTAVTAHATSCVMVPYNGSDGTYNVVSESGYSTVYQSTGSTGSYSGFQYYHRPVGVNFTAGNPLYVEVDYLDLSGSGNIGIQYDSTSNAFQNCNFGLNNSVYNTGTFKTAVYRLDSASFSLAENGGNDMRLTGGGNLQLNVIQVRVSDAPTTLYLQATAFLGPYSGPSYVGGTAVDATTLVNKVVAGYQGWYGAPGDQDNIGWSHWLNGSQLQIDFWPDMAEYTAPERFNFAPYTNADSSQAQLFSSDEARTTLRHFQWMEAWGLDGVAVQRFVGSVPSTPLDRVLTNVRLAANETGRTYFVEYDMSGMAEGNLVSAITNDWNYLNNTLNITADSRYLHQGGQPVIGIFGFFTDRFSTTTANAILDIFKAGSAHPAFVLGSGAWWWNEGTDANWTPAWKSVVYRMGAWQPWNVGNAGGSPLNAGTGYWTDNSATLASNGVMFQPMLYAGCSSVNRDGSPPGSGVPRRSGAVYWNQWAVATSLAAKTAFIAMFDEFSEGTQIAKATGSPPTNAPNSQVYDGMPSDCYLCFTAQGAKMLKGQIAYTTTVPGCAALTQPTIPDPISPLSGATVTTASTTFSWTAALALAGGGSITGYVLNVDGTTYALGNVLTDTLALANGNHWWRVQAVNSMGNHGGYSVAQTFTVSAAATATRTPPATATRTVSQSPTVTPTTTPTRTRTVSQSPTSTPTPTSTATRTASQSPTSSATETATVTRTVSQSPTATQSRTASPVPTKTNTPLPTATASWTASAVPTKTNTPLPTATASWTASPVATKTNTPTSTAVATATPSWTASPAATKTNTALTTATTSWTASPAATKTNTPLPTATASWTASPAATRTNTPTNTPFNTPTLSWTASPVATKTATPTNTAFATATSSWTASPLATKTNTPTNTALPTATPSWTASPMATKTNTPTNSAVATATLSWTASPAATKTGTPTSTAPPTATASWTASAVPTSPTATPLPTWSNTLNSQVLDAEPVPNPQPGPVLGFDIKLSTDCGSVSAALYTPAMVLVAKQTFSGQFRAGWNTLSWPLPTLPNGLYYVAFNTSFGRRARVTRLYILH